MGQQQSVSQKMSTSIMNSLVQRSKKQNRADVTASVSNYIDARNMNSNFLVINQKARVSINLESFAQFASETTLDQSAMAEMMAEASSSVQQLMLGVSDQEVDQEISAAFSNSGVIENALQNSCSTRAKISNVLEIPSSKVGVGWITQEGFADIAAKCLLQDEDFMKASQGVEAKLRAKGKTDSKSLLEALAALGTPFFIGVTLIIVANGYFGARTAQVITKSPYLPVILGAPWLIMLSLMFTLDCGNALPLARVWIPLFGTVPIPHKGACGTTGGKVGYGITFFVTMAVIYMGFRISKQKIAAAAPTNVGI